MSAVAILLLIAAVIFIAAAGGASITRFNLVPTGLAFLTIALLLGAL